MTNIAILGFGVVGGGTADLITDNYKEVTSLCGDGINIKYILDLRDFPDSPFSERVVHDYNVILNDPEVSVVVEVMGGSHPAYEYTLSALRAGKSVVTSNKEVVANFGDEFLSVAKQMGVSYRFEAAVGGGIPVISPMISCVTQNKISEVRGILNGTTNYILTEMFTYGKSFSAALADAQKKGYAESNPDADILGTDAARKIAILTGLATGKLPSTERIHTEGIVKIRSEDVRAAEKLGCTIKLVARCVTGDKPLAFVAPFLVPEEMPLSGVSGVYNAVEVIAEPLGNVMFYGRGAGAGATASAVVGDLCQTVSMGANSPAPVFEKCENFASFSDFKARHYIAVGLKDSEKLSKAFPEAKLIENGDESFVLTAPLSEESLSSILSSNDLSPLSHVRLLS